MKKSFSTRSTWLSYILLIAGCFIIYFPSYNLLPFLSQGDWGRDMYCYVQTSQGKAPYQDYWWNYGPLMPYYYGLLLRVFGASFSAAIIGRNFLNFISGLFIFKSIFLFFKKRYGIVAALWFWIFNLDFTHTFNHAGATSLVLILIYTFLVRARAQENRTKLNDTVILFLNILIFLVKFNIGLATLAASFLCYIFIDANKGQWREAVKILLITLSKMIGILMAVGIIHFLLIRGLHSYQLYQCFQFLPGGGELTAPDLMESVRTLIGEFNIYSLRGGYPLNSASIYLSPWPVRFLFFLTFISAAIFTARIFTKPLEQKAENCFRDFGKALVCLFIFFLFLSSEFIISATNYRFWWALPVLILFCFFLISYLSDYLRPRTRTILLIIFGVFFCFEIYGKYMFKEQIRHSMKYLTAYGQKIYGKNEKQWFDVVKRTTWTLEEQLSENELFFALPYEPLYYYLLRRPAPTWELLLCDILTVTDEQQRRMISDLEQKHVNWILISNRMKSDEAKLGWFGHSYGVLLSEYIDNEFKLFETIGSWEPTGGWISDHAIRIYKRREML